MKSSTVFARWRQCAPHLIHAILGSPEFKSQTACYSWSVQLFLHSSWQTIIMLYNGPSLSPLKIAPSHQGSEPPFNAWFLGTTRAKKPNGVSIGSAVLAWLTSVTDRPTNGPCYSVCNNRPHLRTQYGDADLKQNYPTTSPFIVLFAVPRFSSITQLATHQNLQTHRPKTS